MSGALRFCLVTTFYPPYHFGGDAVFVHRLAAALAALGHNVDVAHSIDAYQLFRSDPQEGFTETPGVRRLPLASRWPRLSSLLAHQLGAPGSYRLLSRILARGRYDVIHFHNISLIGGPSVLRCGDGIKLYTTHEYWLVCPTHVLFRFNREACVEKRCLTCTLHARRPPQAWRLTDLRERCLAHLDKLLLPSEFAKQRHVEDGVIAPMQVLPNFVPIPAAEPEPPQKEPYFLFVGRLEYLKGVQDLLPVLRGLPTARLRLVGEGKLEPELRRLAADIPGIEFVGQVHPSSVAELYRNALAVLVPSLCYEVFPLAAVEALAHGVPVIARRIGALAEIVEESGGGLLFDTLDECREAMQRLMDSPGLRAELSARGRRTALERWSEEAHMALYLDLVRELQDGRTAYSQVRP